MVDAVHGYLASFDAAMPGRLDLDVAVSATEHLSAQLTVS